MIRGIAIIPLYVPAVTKNGTLYTSGEDYQPVPLRRTIGNTALWISSTAGSITITQQVSLDGKTWLDPVDNAGNSLGSVYSALTVTTGKYIVFTPVMAPYIRFKLVENDLATSTVVMKLLYQEYNN
jgi:hypothetical protein